MDIIAIEIVRMGGGGENGERKPQGTLNIHDPVLD